MDTEEAGMPRYQQFNSVSVNENLRKVCFALGTAELAEELVCQFCLAENGNNQSSVKTYHTRCTSNNRTLFNHLVRQHEVLRVDPTRISSAASFLRQVEAPSAVLGSPIVAQEYAEVTDNAAARFWERLAKHVVYSSSSLSCADSPYLQEGVREMLGIQISQAQLRAEIAKMARKMTDTQFASYRGSHEPCALIIGCWAGRSVCGFLLRTVSKVHFLGLKQSQSGSADWLAAQIKQIIAQVEASGCLRVAALCCEDNAFFRCVTNLLSGELEAGEYAAEREGGAGAKVLTQDELDHLAIGRHICLVGWSGFGGALEQYAAQKQLKQQLQAACQRKGVKFVWAATRPQLFAKLLQSAAPELREDLEVIQILAKASAEDLASVEENLQQLLSNLENAGEHGKLMARFVQAHVHSDNTRAMLIEFKQALLDGSKLPAPKVLGEMAAKLNWEFCLNLNPFQIRQQRRQSGELGTNATTNEYWRGNDEVLRFLCIFECVNVNQAGAERMFSFLRQISSFYLKNPQNADIIEALCCIKINISTNNADELLKNGPALNQSDDINDSLQEERDQ